MSSDPRRTRRPILYNAIMDAIARSIDKSKVLLNKHDEMQSSYELRGAEPWALHQQLAPEIKPLYRRSAAHGPCCA